MDTIFVGREAELARLHDCLLGVAARSSTTVLIEGPGGSGKSALLERFAAGAENARLIRASGDEAETAIAYGVHDQLLALLACPDDRNDRATGRRSAIGGRGDLQATGEALLDRLRTTASGHRCLVLIVDDAHLADRPSLAALGYALRRLQEEPVLTILATRPEGAVLLPSGLLTLTGDARITLSGLSVGEIRELAVQHGHQGFGERAARRLLDHTGGSPLHLRALFRDERVGDGGWLSATLPAPAPFARLVAARLHRLSPQARALARAAAVLGLRCDLCTAAEMVEIAEPQAAADQLRAAQIAGVERTRRGLELVFDHSVIRSAVLADSGESDLAAAHRAAARVTQGAEALGHRAKAAAGYDLELADLLAEQARDDATRGGWRIAADALIEAARLHPDRRLRDALLVRGVHALLVAGDLAVAGTYRDQVAALPATARRLQVQALMAWMAGEFAVAESLAEQAWQRAGELEPLERDRLGGLLAMMFIMQGKGEEATAWSRAALAGGLLDDRGHASTLATLVGGLLWEGQAEEAMELLPTDGDLNDAGHRELIGMRGVVQLMSEDPTPAVANLRIRLRPNLVDHRRGQSPLELLTATGPDGIEPNKLVVLLFLAEAEFRRGCWDVTAAIAEQTLGLIEDTGQFWVRPWAHAVAALVPASRGSWEAAETHLAAAEDAAEQLGNELNRGYTANAAVHLAWCSGDAERVVASARWLLEHGRPFYQEPGIHCWPVHYLEALVTLGQLDRASEVLGVWEATAQQRGRRGRIAALARIRGDLATRRRDLSTARRAYQTAFDTSAEDADTLEHALLHLSRGRFLRRRGERRSAVDDLREAEHRFGLLGAQPFLAAVRTELAACGVDPGPEAVRPDAASTLTPQERAVARLAADGRSTKEIAEVLVLSPKTVAYHLSHVYAKVGVRSRSQLVARRPFDR